MSATTIQILNDISPKVLFGGRPFSVNLQLGYSNSPSSLELELINKEGVYTIGNGDLSWSSVQNIKIGNFTFKGYLVKFSERKSVDLKTLTVRYVDCSAKLDRITVGLHKRHGLNDSQTTQESPNPLFRNVKNQVPFSYSDSKIAGDNLILVGKEINPVDILLDNSDQQKAVDIDWCNPCLTCGKNTSLTRRDQFDTLSILDVYYTFEELLTKLGVNIPSKVSGKKIYKNYTGTLRSVLNQWCALYGLTFKWNPSHSEIAGALEFIDLNESVEISENSIDYNITTEILRGASIEEASGQGIVTYYQREGNIQVYPCSDVKLYNLSALQISDLFSSNDFKKGDLSNNAQENYKWFELSVALSYYSSSLRDCLLWFNRYKINGPEQAKARLIKPEALNNKGDTKNKYDGDDVIKKTLSSFGNMQIVEVIDKESNHPFWERCREAVKDIDYYDNLSKKKNAKNKNADQSTPNYYFFVAKMDEELLNNQYTREVNLAKNFMGRFWTRLGEITTCADIGLDTRNTNITIQTPETNQGHYYSEDMEYITNLPFAQFGHTKDSAVAQFVKFVSSPEGQAYGSKKTKSVDLGDGNSIKLNILNSFIFAEREPKWYPNESDESAYQSLIDYYSKLCWNLVGDGRVDFLTEMNPAYADIGYKLFIVQKSDTLPITITKIKNYLEPSKPYKMYNNVSYNELGALIYDGDIEQQQNKNPNSLSVVGQYGLMNNETIWVTFDGFGFMTPVGGCLALEESAFDGNSALTLNATPIPQRGTSFYRVAAIQQTEIPVVIPKVQNIYEDYHTKSAIDSVGHYEVSLIDISSNDLSIFQDKSCVVDPNKIKEYHNQINANLKYLNNSPINTMQVREAGVIQSSSFVNLRGIDTITVEIGPDGAYTTYNFSDKYAHAPNEELLKFQRNIQEKIKKLYKTIDKYKQPNAKHSQYVLQDPGPIG